MNKAGGIIGLIAGIFGVGAALFTLLMGGAGAAFDAAGHDRIIAYGWWGIGSAFMVIVFGAVAIFNGAVGAFGLLAFSLIGAVVGGTAVAIALALGLLGGVLAAFGAKKWWPWAGLLTGLAVAAPIVVGIGDPRMSTAEQSPPNLGAGTNLASLEGEYECNECHGYLQITGAETNTYKVHLSVGGGSCGGEVAIAAAVLPLIDGNSFKFNYKSENATCTKIIWLDGQVAKVSDTCFSAEDESGSTCALLGGYTRMDRTPAPTPATAGVDASCGLMNVQTAVKEDFLNELMIKGGASSYARLWGLINEGESIDARLATDMQRLLPHLSLNEIAADPSPSGCIATLIYGPHTQYPIRAMYTLSLLADGTGFRVESAFTLPESGMAQVNLFQGMQKGLLEVLYERELADRAAKPAPIETTVTATTPPIAPSFDCRKAGTDVERMICNSQELAKADAELAPLHRAALEAAPDKLAFKEEGRDWIRQRDQCQDEACLIDSYQIRTTQLSKRE